MVTTVQTLRIAFCARVTEESFLALSTVKRCLTVSSHFFYL